MMSLDQKIILRDMPKETDCLIKDISLPVRVELKIIPTSTISKPLPITLE